MRRKKDTKNVKLDDRDEGQREGTKGQANGRKIEK
jgi:hypothetical protein